MQKIAYPRVTVETSAQSLLVEEMGNETDRTTKDEQTVEDTHLEVVLGLLSSEGTAVADKVDESDSNGTVNVENQVVLLGGGDGLDSQSVVEERSAGEVGLDVLLDERDTEIGVVARLDTVTNTGNELVLLAHGVDEITGRETLVVGLGELLSGTVEGTTETRTDGQKTGDERGNKILASTGGNDGVHGTRNGRTVIGSKHENHLKELAGEVGQTAAEPQKGHDTTDTDVLFEDIRDGHTGVKELLTTVVGDGGDEGSGLTDETKLLGPGVIDGDLGNSGLRLGLDGAVGDELLVKVGKNLGHVLESVGNVETGILHRLVLHGSSLELGVGERTSVTELDLGLEHASNGTNGPGNNGLLDLAVLDSLNDAVLLNTTDLTEKEEDLGVGVLLVTEQVVNEGSTGVSVTTDSDTLADTVGGLLNDVVELVGHTTGLGDVRNGTRAVELGGNDVVHHTTSVTDLESTGLDTTNGGRTDDGNTLLGGNVKNLTSALFLC